MTQRRLYLEKVSISFFFSPKRRMFRFQWSSKWMQQCKQVKNGMAELKAHDVLTPDSPVRPAPVPVRHAGHAFCQGSRR
jgi:hypothetical protein